MPRSSPRASSARTSIPRCTSSRSPATARASAAATISWPRRRGTWSGLDGSGARRRARPLDPRCMVPNHGPDGTWDPVTDYQMMSRNVRGFMSLFHSEKPVRLQGARLLRRRRHRHGALLRPPRDRRRREDRLPAGAGLGLADHRALGAPARAEKAPSACSSPGDCLTGNEAVEWGLAIEAAPAAELDERFEALLARIARMPINQLVMMKLLVNQTLYAQGLHATQVLGTVFDGIARHTPEGYAFQQRAAEAASSRPCASATSRSATSAWRASGSSSGPRSVVVVGAGFGGIGAAGDALLAPATATSRYSRRASASAASGTTTPIRRACDIPSHLYEFSFAPNPRWSRRYAPQEEIQAYLEDVGGRTECSERTRPAGGESARWDEDRAALAAGDERRPHEAAILLTACGQLSTPKVPPLPGLEDFGSRLPHRRVAARRRPGRQAGRRDRHRLQRDPGGARDPAARRAGRRVSALPRLDAAEDGLRVLGAGAAPVRALPASAAPRS